MSPVLSNADLYYEIEMMGLEKHINENFMNEDLWLIYIKKINLLLLKF